MKEYNVNTYKYDHTIHYSWKSELIEENESYILLKSLPPRKLIHHTRGQTFVYDNASLEFISKSVGFTINTDIYRNGDIEYYCNICSLPILKENNIDIVDFDIDMIIDKEGKYYFVDEDEFEINKIKYQYPDSLITEVNHLKEKLESLYRNNVFPFDGFLLRNIENLRNYIK
ncbi:DUF402 domain-containing protein [Macrococcus armenti]|uniref:DUF402 domain-containing protein n=1 Tax=Macrococcus armenti TaxID=2875764 RepID=UPI001CCDF6D1|nr:DUF402 domain-containing protein [Macrococcus armenti]UBH16467.1 DUF402 domain-containing protein [Macrococcus armenti]UBH18823.1 DUF402 domain-containing protein [Macrococcus armenti]UBH21095.1 DUF402 domain-containing protein [Macrococcus armenti]